MLVFTVYAGVECDCVATIFNMGHSMLLGAMVPMKYWTYAIQYAVYIYNRFPTTTEDGYMAPYEAKYGVAPDVGEIKTWECVCVMHISLRSCERKDSRISPAVDTTYRCS